ncbi:MAG: D-alanine--D-alanine ligase [Chitinophagales bacterium]|nr:D-alanine--D-alanine ligase [Chitinophagales bacterium]
MRIGILFGGASREREISFAGGRTVYDNLNKNLFEPIPVFVDSLGNFILLEWKYLYKGTIRDFYPPVNKRPQSSYHFQAYLESLGALDGGQLDAIIHEVGQKVSVEQLGEKIDFAFLALHGSFGEDGTIQGLLEWMNIPYSGSGILSSSIGMDKVFQKKMMKSAGWNTADSIMVERNSWLVSENQLSVYKRSIKKIGFPLVIRPANQGSSIGVSIIEKDDFEFFRNAVDRAFFIKSVSAEKWNILSQEEKREWVRATSEIKDGTGIPFIINHQRIDDPAKLFEYLEKRFTESQDPILLQSIYEEQQVLLEEFIDGIEFSCIVIRNIDGTAVALPPTEIKKGKEVFDYRSKYLAGMTRKVTPVDLPDELIEKIRKNCERLFRFFNFQVYARIDGFIRKDNKVFLNDPNTTSGMLPSSFFFHQAAEIGLNPSQFLTYIIHTSIIERIQSQPYTEKYRALLRILDESIIQQKKKGQGKKKIGVILGGYSSERHISVESGRNIYEKLASSKQYEPVPIFLLQNSHDLDEADCFFELYQIPVNLLLKDNADDIRDKILHFKKHKVIEKIKRKCKALTSKYSSSSTVFEPKKISLEELGQSVSGVFIALHGRPGEDGHLQSSLEKLGIPYNGSGIEASQITINKYETNELLIKHGFQVAKHALFNKADWVMNKSQFYTDIENKFLQTAPNSSYPVICKPVDDGCSSAVKKINSREELDSFCQLIFRDHQELPAKYVDSLHMKPGEEFPLKQQLLVEDLITANGAKKFLEITCGMVTKINVDGELIFEIFEPSEALAGDAILSLEEKFLAGEGQNITPARFSNDPAEDKRIAGMVKNEMERAAKLLGIVGYCRIDAFVRIYEPGTVETIIIEINSLPGMTPATVIFHQAALNNYKPFDFIDKILEFSFKQKNRG